jgi:hypothetical protein
MHSHHNAGSVVRRAGSKYGCYQGVGRALRFASRKQLGDYSTGQGLRYAIATQKETIPGAQQAMYNFGFQGTATANCLQ